MCDKEVVMKICFPVPQDEGLESNIYGHFGSAPLFVVVDTELRETKAVSNHSQPHAQGACQPLETLEGEQVDAIVVSDIGSDALQGLNRAGLKVYQALGVTIADNIVCLEQEGLPEYAVDHGCAGHGHAHGCRL